MSRSNKMVCRICKEVGVHGLWFYKALLWQPWKRREKMKRLTDHKYFYPLITNIRDRQKKG